MTNQLAIPSGEPVPAVGPAVKFAGNEFVKHFILIFGSLLVVTVVEAVLTSWIPHGIRTWVQIFLAPLWQSFFLGGLMMILISLVDGNEPPFSMLWSRAGTFWKYWIAHWMFGIAVFIGTLLFIAPGVFLAIRFGYYLPCMAENDLGLIESFERSWKITEGAFGKLFVFGLALFGIVLIPIIIVIAIAGILSMVLSKSVGTEIGMTCYSLVMSFGVSIVMTFYYPAWIHAYKQVSLKTTNVGPAQITG